MTAAIDFTSHFSAYHEKINGLLKQVLSRNEPSLLYEPMRYTLEAGGKRLRPLLVLLSTEAVGGEIDAALNAAVAVELLHNFTLIHDDVMDCDDMRRGRPTVHKKWDVGVAILSGDGLVALSYDVLLSSPVAPIGEIGIKFSRTLLEICEGQSLDKSFELQEVISTEDYFDMIRRKTAVLLALCCELGGIIGGGSPEQIQALYQFGLNLGMAFQIQDDLLDILAEQSQIGKTWGSDVKRKKKTLLLLEAMRLGGQQEVSQIRTILAKSDISDSDVEQIRDIYHSTGAVRSTRDHLERFFETARCQLQLLPASESRDKLENILNFVVTRSH